MAKRRSARSSTATLIPEVRPLRFDERLVLNQWMLRLFEIGTFEALAKHLKTTELEGLDEDQVHKFLRQITILWEFEEFPGDTLLTVR